ncbi:MAG: flippase-like domain-containing protein [Clostridia bacterium]|nr:flippase-like domain-containing protein [Clostridia bacterium]
MFRGKFKWMLLFFILALLSIGTVITRSESFSAKLLIEAINNANDIWLVVAIIGMLGNIFFEGLALSVLIKALVQRDKNQKIKSHGFLYSAADIYFSAITPSASGGQPASAFFMCKDGLTVAETAFILMINLLFYTASLIIIGIGGFLLCPSIFMELDSISKLFIILGTLVITGLCIFFILILQRENWVRIISNSIFKFIHKIWPRFNNEKYTLRLENSIVQYRNCAKLVMSRRGPMTLAFLFNLLQRLMLLSTPLCVYLAFGGSVSYLYKVISAQALVLVGVYSMPIPGGMGVADYLLIDGLDTIPDIYSPANLELISRGISFYSCIIIAFIVVVIGLLSYSNKNSSK